MEQNCLTALEKMLPAECSVDGKLPAIESAEGTSTKKGLVMPGGKVAVDVELVVFEPVLVVLEMVQSAKNSVEEYLDQLEYAVVEFVVVGMGQEGQEGQEVVFVVVVVLVEFVVAEQA